MVDIDERERRAHLLVVAVIGLIKDLIGIGDGVGKHLIAERLGGVNVTSKVVGNALGKLTAGYLAVLMAAHTVTHDEQAVIGSGFAQRGKDGILLIASLALIPNGLRLFNLDNHSGNVNE